MGARATLRRAAGRRRITRRERVGGQHAGLSVTAVHRTSRGGGGGQPSVAANPDPMMTKAPTRARPQPKSKPWTRPNPKPEQARTQLSDAQKAAARERADEAGRRYPNLVDNMWASRHVASDGSPES